MNGFKDKNDAVLVELALLGDQEAFEELVTRHQRAVRGTALKVTEDAFSADDASQEAFLSAWLKLDSLREPLKFGSWVCTIAKNKAKAYVIGHKNAVAEISLDFGAYNTVADDDKLLEMYDIASFFENERDQRLCAAVEALDEAHRETVRLHYFEGFSVKEISDKLNVPQGTVKWRLADGRRRIAKELGVMTDERNDKAFVKNVMYRVEQLKLWGLRLSKKGFENEYKAVLKDVECLVESRDKHRALAEVLLRGYWWLPGEKNDAVLRRIKASAEKGRNEDVLEAVVTDEWEKFGGKERIDFILNSEIPYCKQHGFKKVEAYCRFWLGYYYVADGETTEGIAAFKSALDGLDENDIYYANALSAIAAETECLAIDEEVGTNVGLQATAEAFKLIDGKLYYWRQPGYSRNNTLGEAVFWHCSLCDNLYPDEAMPLNEKFYSSDGNVTMYCKEQKATVTAVAGTFEGCMTFVWEIEKPYAGVTYCETVFCPNIGIVRQTVKRNGGEKCWELKSCEILGGSGLLPLGKGNSWEYTTRVDGVKYRIVNRACVVGVTEDSAIISKYSVTAALGYEDTWLGNILKARREYFNTENDTLRDVSDCYTRARALAERKREKRHTSIAENVMQRILATDSGFNKDYTEKGRWNFFGVYNVRESDERIVLGNDREFSFEWKSDMRKCGSEGRKVLYSRPYSILCDAVGAVWDEKFTAGYSYEDETDGIKTAVEVTEENIEIGLGVFDGCRHIKVSEDGYRRGMSYLNGTADYWFAPNVGMVRFSFSDKDGKAVTVWELTESRGVGSGFFPLEDGMFRKYEPTVLGDGWHASVEYTFDRDETGAVIFRNALGTQEREWYEAELKLQNKH